VVDASFQGNALSVSFPLGVHQYFSAMVTWSLFSHIFDSDGEVKASISTVVRA
jgi:hypothetical protein